MKAPESESITKLFKRVRMQLKQSPVQLDGENPAQPQNVEIQPAAVDTTTLPPPNQTQQSQHPMTIAPLSFKLKNAISKKRRSSSEMDSLLEALNEKCVLPE
jgi:hypothetical protein